MARQVWVYRDGEVVEIEKAAPRQQTYLVSDCLPDVMHPSNGKRYSSKSKYYADTKAMGGEIVGNDSSALKREYKSSRPSEPAGNALYRNWERMGGS